MAIVNQSEMSSGVEDNSKPESQFVEVQANTPISEAYRAFLIERHGTADLEPLPDFSDEDPYNWRFRKKIINLLLVAFHAFMSTFTAAAIQSAFEDISVDLNVSISQASYLTSLVIAVLGVAPLFWRPLADRFGRRPIFLLSLITSLVGNVGCAVSPSYATMALCRAITAFCISPASAIGSGVVQETFFKHERARYMGIWTMFVTLGVPVAPFIFGFVALRVGYRWIYWILACTNGIQLLLYTFLGPETLYLHDQRPLSQKASFTNLFRFRRLDRTPIGLSDFIDPIRLAVLPSILIPAVAYSMVFCVAGVLPTIEIPQIYVHAFHFNTQQVGLQNLAIIIGTVLGEQMGGFASDRWMSRQKNRKSPEFRLWLSYIGYFLAATGLIVFLVCLEESGQKWNIAPTIGAGISAAGVQVVTTVLITYAVDCYRDKSAAIGVFITLVRQIWGFIGPFWFPPMIGHVGLRGSAGVVVALIAGISMIPTMVLQWKGSSWH